MKERVEEWYSSGGLMWWFAAIIVKLVLEGGASIIVALGLWLGTIGAIQHLPITIENPDILGILALGAAFTGVWDTFIEKRDE